MPGDIDHCAVDGNRHAHEEIDVADDIAAVEPELRQRFDEIAKAAMCAADAVAQEVVGLATASVDRVVPTASIFHDRKQRFCRDQNTEPCLCRRTIFPGP